MDFAAKHSSTFLETLMCSFSQMRMFLLSWTAINTNVPIKDIRGLQFQVQVHVYQVHYGHLFEMVR